MVNFDKQKGRAALGYSNRESGRQEEQVNKTGISDAIKAEINAPMLR